MNEPIWNIESLKEHFDDLRAADQRALQIKESADDRALGLAREIQTYKDEKANELREQINSERGLYITRAEFKPIVDYVTSQQGRSSGFDKSWAIIITIVGVGLVILGLVLRK